MNTQAKLHVNRLVKLSYITDFTDMKLSQYQLLCHWLHYHLIETKCRINSTIGKYM